MLWNNRAEEHMRERKGEKGAQMPLDKARPRQVDLRARRPEGKESELNVKAGLPATDPRGDHGKGMRRPK